MFVCWGFDHFLSLLVQLRNNEVGSCFDQVCFDQVCFDFIVSLRCIKEVDLEGNIHLKRWTMEIFSLQLLCVIAVQNAAQFGNVNALRFGEKSNWFFRTLFNGIKSFPAMPMYCIPDWFGSVSNSLMTRRQMSKLQVLWYSMSLLMQKISLPCMICGGFAAFLMGDTRTYGDIDIIFAVSSDAEADAVFSEVESVVSLLVAIVPYEISLEEHLLGAVSAGYPPFFKLCIGEYKIDIISRVVCKEELAVFKRNKYLFSQRVIRDHYINIVKCVGIMCGDGKLIVSRVACREKLSHPDKCEDCGRVWPHLGINDGCWHCSRIRKYDSRTICQENPLDQEQLNFLKCFLTEAFQE